MITVSPENVARLLERPERDAFDALKNGLAQLKATHPGAPPRAMVLNDSPTPIEPHVFLRGNPGRPGKQVPRQFLGVLSAGERKPFQNGSGRLELALEIASKNNPLTARVLVNRIWLNHFGTGLVGTPSDFGRRSDLPSHPELIDWLAADFMNSGWSLKSLHRRIVLSSTYRQRSDIRPELASQDPQNRLYARFNRRRLEFEAVRDAILFASGSLDPRMGGRGAPIADLNAPARRTIYGFIDRQNLDPVYRTFDFASPDSSSPRRLGTTVPQQALFMMNSPFVIQQAQKLAAQSVSGQADAAASIQQIYQRLYGREPDTSELTMAMEFLTAERKAEQAQPATVWSYGQGSADLATAPEPNFKPFSHWTGSVWQPTSVLPDPAFGHLHLRAGGGHVGFDNAHAAVVRWTAPQDLTVAIEGELSHEGQQGNGVRSQIVVSRQGVIGEWIAFGATVETRVDRLEVQAGDTIDFMVDGRGEHGFDTFGWAPKIREAAGSRIWDAKAEFHGPVPAGLSPWDALAQVLLLTNEFMFVD